jgi:hypothetical protein
LWPQPAAIEQGQVRRRAVGSVGPHPWRCCRGRAPRRAGRRHAPPRG